MVIANRGNAAISIEIIFGSGIANMVTDSVSKTKAKLAGMGMMIRVIRVQHRRGVQVANHQRKHCNQDQKRSGHRSRLTAKPVNCKQGKSGFTDALCIAKLSLGQSASMTPR